MAKKTDLRYQKTHKLLRSEFIKTMTEKDFEDISVTELARRCEINRKTFYLHYNSLNDLLNEITDEVFRDLTEKTEKYMGSVKYPTFEGLYFMLDSAIQSNYDFYMCILTSPQYMSLLSRIQDHLAQLCSPLIREELNIPERERRLIVIGVVSCIFETYRRNELEGLHYKPQEIFGIVSKYIDIQKLLYF